MHLDESPARRFLTTVEHVPISASVELGAFDAEYSRRMAASYPDMPVLAFEANPIVYQRFRKQIQASVPYRNAAVSDRNGFARLQIQLGYDDQGEASNNSVKRRLEEKRYGHVEVPSDRLDSLCSGLESIALWIDAESANCEVLMGAKNVLSKTMAIFIETECKSFFEQQWRHDEVGTLFASHGTYQDAVPLSVELHLRTKGMPAAGRPPGAVVRSRRRTEEADRPEQLVEFDARSHQ